MKKEIVVTTIPDMWSDTLIKLHKTDRQFFNTQVSVKDCNACKYCVKFNLLESFIDCCVNESEDIVYGYGRD